MRSLLTGTFLVVGLSSAAMAGAVVLRSRGARLLDTPPVRTLACVLVIAAFSVVQLANAPALLPLFMRAGPRLVAAEPWRLMTSLLVQDGGWAGAVFNLSALFAIGALAERVLGRRRWAVVALGSVLVAQAVALSWQPVGAGNSILNFGLAGALCAACLASSVRPSLLLAVVGSACFSILLFMRDIHGVAGVTGALIEALSLFARQQGRQE